jgi:hypothetical protein
MKNLACGICAALAIFSSCSTPAPKSCITERTKESVVRWGEYSTRTGQMRAYQFDGTLFVAKYLRESQTDTNTLSPIRSLPSDDFCKYLSTTLRTFDTVQTLYAPGEIARFVEYSSTATKTTIRAVWNPEFKTYGSTAFRSVYDSLMTIIPQEHRW